MADQTRWRTDDPCPVCATVLIAADDAAGANLRELIARMGHSSTRAAQR